MGHPLPCCRHGRSPRQQGQQGLTNRMTGIFGLTRREITDRGLRTATLTCNLRLAQTSSLEVGNKGWPVHRCIISETRLSAKRITDECIG